MVYNIDIDKSIMSLDRRVNEVEYVMGRMEEVYEVESN